MSAAARASARAVGRGTGPPRSHLIVDLRLDAVRVNEDARPRPGQASPPTSTPAWIERARHGEELSRERVRGRARIRPQSDQAHERGPLRRPHSCRKAWLERMGGTGLEPV